mmetsp:Transcript_9733/g.29429  ORF Transcript_9733/g.29429 Transcript_9733/m.29429 type:complete len:124 (+) Transcript_9733:30-401(+)
MDSDGDDVSKGRSAPAPAEAAAGSGGPRRRNAGDANRGSDLRDPSAIFPYVSASASAEYDPPAVPMLLSLVALMLKLKLAAWGALFFAMHTYITSKGSGRQFASGIMSAISALGFCYFMNTNR